MKRPAKLIIVSLAVMMLATACGTKPTAEQSKPQDIADGPSVSEENPTETPEEDVKENSVDESVAEQGKITSEQALAAIKNYCYAQNPDLKDIVEAGEQEVYWEDVSEDENEIVILYRSYTAAQIRYYINPDSGETYVTEFVPGIMTEEERSDETFNVKDFME